ncbi:hypothetical protein C900_05682 [Fulvivirga imtechensis AK7]|uniref:N-acetylmuramoyl-L-alanine amidase n=1 Tax=Fulvivirga imtechensis AK7 TaxID=1237149 RepID=L8JIZ8_9BACT|nr:peptidoglycan recognition family protein [Fulvivirga imtechensis]ELR68856.1 hypothetical protein C900_05682 [Fulvivirga imtechensis AK7]
MKLISQNFKKQWLAVFLLIACQSEPRIVQKPIIYNHERERLSLEYIRERYGMELDSAKIDPKIIVVHWTAYPDLKQSFDAFYPPVLPGTRADIQSAGSLNVSAHFLVDRDGTIYQLLPETTFARHVIGLNYCAIGIENVADGHEYPLTEAQFEANKALIAYLIKKYSIEYLIGHDQYKNFIGHELWKEKDPDYLTDKDDVGKEFIDRLHEAIGNKALKKAPGEK